MNPSYKVAIIGDGGWGTTLSLLLWEKGHEITLWSHDPEYAMFLRKKRENVKFLPGPKIPLQVQITANMDEATDGKDFILLAVPSKFFREVIKRIREFPPQAIFVSLAKGLEIDTFKRMSEIVREEMGDVRIAVLSGPSIAYEVVNRNPTSVVVASKDPDTALKVQELFFSERFRVYTSDDVIGVELGGALKNIVAIAAGICDGLGFGNNSKAALLSRGLVELIRFGKQMGAKAETFFGLSGLGDMITTCFSPKSRNRWVGEEIGRGKSLEEILEKMEMVAEGVYTVRAVYNFSKLYNINMPITEKVYEVLYRGKDPKEAVSELMRREPKHEVIG